MRVINYIKANKRILIPIVGISLLLACMFIFNLFEEEGAVYAAIILIVALVATIAGMLIQLRKFPDRWNN